MDIDTILAAGWASILIVIGILVAVAAVFYAIVKRKKDYNSTGIPKQVERPEEKEGSTDNK